MCSPHDPPICSQERIRTGKELAAAKKLEEELALKRTLEQRQREKDEARLAREKIRLKLGELAWCLAHTLPACLQASGPSCWCCYITMQVLHMSVGRLRCCCEWHSCWPVALLYC